MKVHWTDAAEGHLDALYAYIAQDSPEYAKRMVDRLTQRSQQIAEFPLSGRRVPEYDIDQIREVIEGPDNRIEPLPFKPEDFENDGILVAEIKKTGIVVFKK